jgi:cyclopropane fatty-acyl-phospholipid synthase-like methyltransferase
MRPHWDAKADRWDGHLPRTELFAELRETVLSAARPTGHDVAIDLGSGSGFLTIPFARCVRRLYAVDHSERMLSHLGEKLADESLCVHAWRGDLRTFAPPEPVDIVVSNYALHHLRHSAKLELLRRCRTWMNPGGRIVVADLMVPLTMRPGQSDALLRKVRSIAAKGLPGYWRIAKNVVRWATGRGEYPESLEFWTRALGETGFADIGGRCVGTESGVVWGRRP